MIEVHLSQFDGPLDLLLHLIQKAEVDITEIFVSDITAQYMAYMEQIDELDMDTASDFLQMAATLLYIKSRSLLPRPRGLVVEEEEDPEQQLIRQIREYKACKEASEHLLRLGEEAANIFVRLPEECPLPPPKVELEGIPISALYDAFAALLIKETEKKDSPTHEVQRDVYAISDCEKLISQKLASGTTHFEELFPRDGGKLGIVVTFMALLEMAAKQRLRIYQETAFSRIVVEAA